jgi:hypothetical protein
MQERFSQRPYERDGEESDFAIDYNDTKNYKTKYFELEKCNDNSWRVFDASRSYVDVPAYLGKIIRNSIVAQNRAHADKYSHHETTKDELLEWHENEFDDKKFRPLVSAVLRDIYCHKLVLHVLRRVQPSHPLAHASDSEYDTALKDYFKDTHYNSLRFQRIERDNKKAREGIYKDVTDTIKTYRGKFPLVCRINVAGDKDSAATRDLHSFVILGISENEEIFCLEKMGWGSLPVRLCKLPDIAKEYWNWHSLADIEWQFAPVDELIKNE